MLRVRVGNNLGDGQSALGTHLTNGNSTETCTIGKPGVSWSPSQDLTTHVGIRQAFPTLVDVLSMAWKENGWQ